VNEPKQGTLQTLEVFVGVHHGHHLRLLRPRKDLAVHFGEVVFGYDFLQHDHVELNSKMVTGGRQPFIRQTQNGIALDAVPTTAEALS
jgi:hypothetical protein